jgi:hypothetical protein
MITYLKNEHAVIKVNEDEKTLRIINNTVNGGACIFETNINIFADVTILKKGEGFFVDATEAEYLSVKEQVRLKFLEF